MCVRERGCGGICVLGVGCVCVRRRVSGCMYVLEGMCVCQGVSVSGVHVCVVVCQFNQYE